MNSSILPSTVNRFNGVIIEPQLLPEKELDFSQKLLVSLEYWTTQAFLVVWLKLPKISVHLLPVAYSAGFENHHCGVDFIMLTKRLQQDALIPAYATHSIGVGGLVINQQNQLLTIKEKAHIVSHPHNWKFPGGMLDPFEHFEAGVIREVFEETGVATRFGEFLGFRHHHQGQFNVSNIYAVCRLYPLSDEITIQESEIAQARWFPVDEYLADEKIGTYNKQILKSALATEGLRKVRLENYMSNNDEYEVFLKA